MRAAPSCCTVPILMRLESEYPEVKWEMLKIHSNMKSNHIFCISKQVCRSLGSFVLSAVAWGGILNDPLRLT